MLKLSYCRLNVTSRACSVFSLLNYLPVLSFLVTLLALNASIRTARIASPLSMSIELTAVVVAVVNFIYVILLTSDFSAPWFDGIDLELGATITVAGLAELLMRTNPLQKELYLIIQKD